MRAPIIALEGLDAVGKTTLARALTGWQPMSTPGPAWAVARREVHALTGTIQPARQLFYAASVITVGHEAWALAGQGQSVVIDRYWASTIAYGLTRGTGLRLEEVEAWVPPVDLTILLTLEEGERHQRMMTRGQLTDADAETLAPGFVDTTLRHYRRLAGRPCLGRWVEIDVTGLDRAQVVDRLHDLLAAETKGDIVRLPWRGGPYAADSRG